jgi:hypothetical protein
MIHKHVAWAVAVLLLHPIVAAAEDAVRARIGTLGLGVEYRHELSPHTAWRALLNGATTDGRFTESDVKYDYDFKRRSAGLVFDWHPNAGKFFVSTGLLYNKNKIEARIAGNGSVEIGNTTYSNPDLSGDLTFKEIAPYLGTGWMFGAAHKGISMAFELGVLYQGSSDVHLHSSVIDPADLRKEEHDLENSLDEYKYYPNITFAIGYRF